MNPAGKPESVFEICWFSFEIVKYTNKSSYSFSFSFFFRHCVLCSINYETNIDEKSCRWRWDYFCGY